jgi:hypothetical protein
MKTIVRCSGLTIGLLGLGAVLSGCPAKKPDQAAAPVVKIRENTAETNAGGKQLVDSGQFQVNRTAEGQATATPPPGSTPPDPANPRPTGDNWVFVPALKYHVGDKLHVEYQLGTPNPNKAWVGLIPEDVAATDGPSNDAADVAYAYTTAAKSATLEIGSPQPGRFKLRLFSSNEPDARLLGETPVLTIEQWPQGDLASKIPPYVTLDRQGANVVEVAQGSPVSASYEVPAGYSGAWIGVIPAATTSKIEGENDAVDVAYIYLENKLKDVYTWTADQPGTYVFRIFPSSEATATAVAESEPFTVKPKS